MSEYPCDDPKCCCNTPIEIDYENAIEIDYQQVLKYKKRYNSWSLGLSRAALEHFKENGTPEEIKRRKQIWRWDKATHRRVTARALFRKLKRGFLLPSTGDKTNV